MSAEDIEPLLAAALEAAGGVARWRAARRIGARVRTWGLLPQTRFAGNRLADFRAMAEVGEQRVALEPFPAPGRRGVLDGSEVRIESTGGEILAGRADPRSRFFGAAGLRRNLRWDELDTVYFGGYAIWNYLLTPLLLTRPEITAREGPGGAAAGAPWRRLDAVFGPGLETHSREQRFHFDLADRLIRHDYTAEIVGGWAKAAHYCGGYRSFDGLLFPARRRVRTRRRNGSSRPRPTVVAIDFDEIEVEFGRPGGGAPTRP